MICDKRTKNKEQREKTNPFADILISIFFLFSILFFLIQKKQSQIE